MLVISLITSKVGGRKWIFPIILLMLSLPFLCIMAMPQMSLNGHPTQKGIFSVKSAFQCTLGTMVTSRSQNFDWNHVWKLKVQHRLWLMLGKIMAEALPLRGKLANAIGCSNAHQCLCPLCEEGVETASHLFLKCHDSQYGWPASILDMMSIFMLGGQSRIAYQVPANLLMMLVSKLILKLPPCRTN